MVMFLKIVCCVHVFILIIENSVFYLIGIHILNDNKMYLYMKYEIGLILIMF